MDPLTLAVHHMHASLQALLAEAPPGATSSRPMARLVVEGVNANELFKALRLYELKPSNRHAFLIVTDDVVDESTYLQRIAAQFVGDARSIGQGLAEEGVELPTVPLDAQPSVEALARFVDELRTAVSKQLDGIVVILLPRRVSDRGAYLRVARSIAEKTAPGTRSLALLVFDAPTEGLSTVFPTEVALRVNVPALQAYLREGRSPASAGPARAGAQTFSPDARRALEQKLGQRIPGKDAAQTLRHLLFDGAIAQSEGKLDLSAKKFRMARTYAEMLGLHAERAACAVAVGSLRLALGQKEASLRAYQEARRIGEKTGQRDALVQAEFGIAAAHLAVGAFELARGAYRRAAAETGGNTPLLIECARMIGHTFALENRNADAVQVWLEALSDIEKLEPGARAGTAYPDISDALVRALGPVGKSHEVQGIAARRAAIAASIERARDEAIAAEARC